MARCITRSLPLSHTATMADEDTINLVNMIVSLCIVGVLLISAFALTLWVFEKWRSAMHDARVFYSVVVELPGNVALVDIGSGEINNYDAVVNQLGADINRGQVTDGAIPDLVISVSYTDYSRLSLGHTVAYGGPPSSKIHYEDAPLRYAEVQKAISVDKALVDSTGDEGMRLRRLTSEVTSM